MEWRLFPPTMVLAAPPGTPIIRASCLRGIIGAAPGDIVEVRPAAEMLATLDGKDTLNDLPFMPEMLQCVGRRFLCRQAWR